MGILSNLFENHNKNLDGITSSIIAFNPFIYFSAGETLNDKDSDYNIDALAIHKFFKPIDNLFGDYEVKKKFKLGKTIFTKGIFDKPNDYLPNLEDFQKLKFSEKEEEFKFSIKDDKEEILKGVSNKYAIIYFVIFYNKKKYSLQVDAFISNSENIRPNTKADFINGITKKVKKDFSVLQILALDPEKLIQTVDLDEKRIEHFKKVIVRNEDISLETVDIFLKEVFSTKSIIESNKIEFDIYDTQTREVILKNLEFHNRNEDFINLLNLFTKRTYKLKNFEKHKYFKARIGFENGQFVLFLHPYESESNGPIRFPPQD